MVDKSVSNREEGNIISDEYLHEVERMYYWITNSYFVRHHCEVYLTPHTQDKHISPFVEVML